MAIGAIWEVTLEGQGPSGEQLVNVLHYMEVSPSTGTDAGNVTADVAEVEDVLIEPYLAVITEGYKYVKTSMRSVSGYTPQLIAESIAHADQTGQDVEPAGPIERCILLGKFTGTGGRSGRGRVYVPLPRRAMYLSDGQLDPAFPGGAAVTALCTALGSSVVCASGLVLFPCIYNRFAGTARTVVNVALRAGVGVQRRRRFGVGS